MNISIIFLGMHGGFYAMQHNGITHSVNALLKGVCIRLTRHLHNQVLCMFMTTVVECHSLNYDIFNANMTLFEMSLL